MTKRGRMIHIASITQASQYTHRFARRLFGGVETSSLESRFARNAAASFGLKFLVIGFSFFSSLLLARFLGAVEYGVYIYALAWVNFLSAQTLIGLDRLLIREVAANQTESAWGATRGLLRWSDQVALTLSLGMGLLAAGIGWALARHTYSSRLPVFFFALILLPVLTITRLRQSAIQGLHHVVAGQIPEALIQPAVFIVLIVGAHQLLASGLTASGAVGLNATAAGAALLVGAALLRYYLPQSSKNAPPTYKTRLWISTALPLLLVNSLSAITTQAPILLLGAIKGSETAGIYAVASRVSDLIAFGLISANMALAPVVAKLWAERDVTRLQHVVTTGVRAILVFSLPVAVGMIIFGERILSIFGREFTEGQSTLTILVIGQIGNVATGSVGLLLLMTGHEREVAITTAICATLNIVLNLILIPSFGMVGTALAVASSLIIWNILLAICVYRRLGIHSTALGRV